MTNISGIYDFNAYSPTFPSHTGIYSISGCYNTYNLVGQCRDSNLGMRSRFCRHRYDLINNKHDNPYIQYSYNNHTTNDFKFVVLEICETGVLNARENYWIKELNSLAGNSGWNMFTRSARRFVDNFSNVL